MEILVYQIKDFIEEGGGTYFEDDTDFKNIDDRVNELAKQYGEKFNVICAGRLTSEYKYKPVEKIVKYERK